MRNLFLFTIGPVQSFIAQARKTQDLYSGSFILSHLCRTAAQKAKDDYKATIIFPNINNISVPNRFIATVESYDEKYLNDMGNFIEKTVREKFNKIANAGLTHFTLEQKNQFKNQLKALLDIHWLFYPIGKNRYIRISFHAALLDIHWLFYPIGGKNYKDAYKKTEMLLGGIKNARPFSSLPETGRKCTLTGEHNALFFRRQIPPYQKGAIEVPEKVPLKIIAKGEALSAVAWAKRCAEYYFSKNGDGYEGNFPSTARISLMEQIPKEKMDVWEKKLDAQLFYPENINEKYLTRNGISKSVSDISEKSKNIIDELNLKSGLSKYYAVMMFDGDNMGQWMSGKFLNSSQNPESFQNYLSTILSDFAKWCQDYINEEDKIGRTVYAGGDDFLGFVNLARLFDVLNKIRTEFKKQVSDKIKKKYKTQEMTISAGIAIAHYKMPLSVVLKWARQMEKEAKMIAGKNALSVAVLRRSGGITRTSYKWFENKSKDAGLIPQYLNDIIEQLNKEYFSNAFINHINTEFERLMDNEGNYKDIKGKSKDIVKTELNRLVKRSANITTIQAGIESELQHIANNRLVKSSANITTEVIIDSFITNLNTLFDNSEKLFNFLSALKIIDFITRGVSRD